MTLIDEFPASDLAKNKARREVEEAMEANDPVERLVLLISAGNSFGDVGDDYGGDPGELLSPAFQHGVRVAVRTLLAAGLPEDQLPIEGLQDKVAKVSLNSSVRLEAGYDGDLADLYLKKDGGSSG